MAGDRSLLKPLGYQKKDSCGYCKDGSGSSSYYLSCDNIRVDHYQELMDRGWRRSGNLYYKQDLPRSCCPHYTIRLDSAAFKPSKEQRKVLNQWNRYVLGYDYIQKEAILCSRSREEKRQKRGQFNLLEVVHMSEYSRLQRPKSRRTGELIEPIHKLEVTLEADSFTKEKYNVFLRYQMTIHKEPKSRWSHASFKRFLCSGLNQRILKIEGKTLKLGSYHQCYRLDGKLIAVGVLDLLPHAVSSVYLFYDPDYEQWGIGKLSALREIALSIEGQYQFYYMGFYIHSCRKMKYKGTFTPSYILDPESLQWDLLDDEVRRKLDKSPYLSLSRERMREAKERNAETINGVTSTVNDEGETLGDATGRTKQSGQTTGSSNDKNIDPDLEFDSDESDQEEMDIPEGSLFDYHMPGVLTRDEVAKLDLDHWKLFIRGTFIDLEDLRTWEDSSLDDPYSMKGIAGELAATIGPKVMQDSAIVMFN